MEVPGKGIKRAFTGVLQTQRDGYYLIFGRLGVYGMTSMVCSNVLPENPRLRISSERRFLDYLDYACRQHSNQAFYMANTPENYQNKGVSVIQLYEGFIRENGGGGELDSNSTGYLLNDVFGIGSRGSGKLDLVR